jgi:hypothetical protein
MCLELIRLAWCTHIKIAAAEDIGFHMKHICGHLKVIREVLWVSLRSCNYSGAALTFPGGISMAGLDSERGIIAWYEASDFIFQSLLGS